MLGVIGLIFALLLLRADRREGGKLEKVDRSASASGGDSEVVTNN